MSSVLTAAFPGLTWKSTGFVGLSGPLLALAEAIDARFLELAAAFSARAQYFGPLLSVDDLRRIDYFSAFPHLVTFPACAAPDPATLREFALANGSQASGALRVGETAAIQCILAPAACYGVYISAQGLELAVLPQVVTVRSTCFRAEVSYVPLERQPSFSMRELVHLGTAGSVQQFLMKAQEQVAALATAWQLPTSIEVATDPFFVPPETPKYLHAKLFPSKHELVHQGLALASFNNHRNFFGRAYRITSAHESIHTACVAFGVERWVAAILHRHGHQPVHWPLDLAR